MTQLSKLATVLVGAMILADAAAAQPLTTAFTYQGELLNQAIPAAGTFDFQFRLFDSAAGTTQLGGTQCADNVVVTDGRFAASIDFGSQFDGNVRYLEILVRADTGLTCASAGGFIILSPRTSLAAAPHASYSIRAGTATFSTNLNGQPASFYTNAGNLATGTIPDARLAPVIARLNANQTFTGILSLSNAANTYAGSGALLSSLNAANISSGILPDSRLSANVPRLGQPNAFGAFDNTFAGRLGVGVATPSEALHVAGNGLFSGGIAIGTTTSPRPGTIRFNAGLRRFEGYTGGWWVALTATTIAPTVGASYAAAGTYTYTVPSGIYSLAVDGWSGGGGGGGSAGGTLGTACGNTGPGGGGGGGSGAYGMSILEVTPGETITIIVGSAGVGGTSGQPGVQGGNTTVIHRGSAVLSLSGGLGGRQGNSDPILAGNPCPPSPTSGSAGGTGGSVVTANAGSVNGAFGQNGSAPYNLGGCGFPNFPDMRAGCGGSRGAAVGALSPLGSSAGQGGLGGVWLNVGGPGSLGAPGAVRVFY